MSNMEGTTPIEDLDDEPIETNEGPVSPTPTVPEPPVVIEEDEVDTSGYGEKKNATWTLFGNEYDVDSAIVLLLTIIISVIIWRTTGLYKTLHYDPIFIIIFVLFIAYAILNIFTSGTTSGNTVHELNILLTVEQMISILFGTVVLFALFFDKIPLHENCKTVVSRLSLSIIIILTIASMWVNVISSGRAFRMVRKFKQGVYNISLALFVLIGLILFKGKDCSPKRVTDQLLQRR